MTSLANAFRGNYEGAIRAFWLAHVGQLPTKAALLDMGTGNAALPLLFAEHARSNQFDWRIVGVDLAKIDVQRIAEKHPDAANYLPDIELHSRVDMTRLPFPDQSFDFVSGQYAVEYAALDKAIAEVSRVLKPEGRSVFMVHHVDSVILQTAAEEFAHAALIFDNTKVFVRAKSLIRAMGDVDSPETLKRLRGNPQCERKRQLLNEALAELNEAQKRARTAALAGIAIDKIAALFNEYAFAPLKVRLEYLRKAQEEIRANVTRLEDLRRAAKSETDIEDVRTVAQAHGFQHVKIGPFHDEQGRLLGWQVVLTKALAESMK